MALTGAMGISARRKLAYLTRIPGWAPLSGERM